MNKYTLTILTIIIVCITSCQPQPQSGALLTIPVDLSENKPTKLSEITEDIKKISLEFTDESIIGRIEKVIYQNDHLIVLDGSSDNKVLIFDSKGKFIRKIGRKGQGPGEYTRILDIAFDSKDKNIYIAASGGGILCFNINGVFVNEYKINYAEYINFRNGYLNVFSTSLGEKVESGFLNQTKLYKIDKECNIADSLVVKSVYLSRVQAADYPIRHYLSHVGEQTFVYYPVLTAEPIVRDTLYELRNNIMIPYLKLRFSDDGAVDSNNNKTKTLLNVWKSGMYVFANYSKKGSFLFMHNLETGRSANMLDGIEDDIHNNGKIIIAPLQDNYVYYHFDDETNDDNPDIYIVKLK